MATTGTNVGIDLRVTCGTRSRNPYSNEIPAGPIRSRRKSPNHATALNPVTAQPKSGLVRILLDPDSIHALAPVDVPTLLGDLERIRGTLWAHMLQRPPADASSLVRDIENEVLTIPEVARELRFTRAYVYEAVRRGDITALRTGKYIRVRRTDLRAWLEGRSTKGLDPQAKGVDSPRHAASRASPGSRARTAASVSDRIHATRRPTAHPLNTV